MSNTRQIIGEAFGFKPVKATDMKHFTGYEASKIWEEIGGSDDLVKTLHDAHISLMTGLVGPDEYLLAIDMMIETAAIRLGFIEERI